MIRAVLFDLDDTLYDESSYVTSGFREVAARIAGDLNVDATRVLDFMQAELARSGRGKVFDTTLAAFGAVPVPERVAALLACYRAHRPQIALFDDAAACLEALSGYRLAVVTDGLPVMQRNKAAALGLEQRVNTVVYCWEQGCPKPDPGAYLEALARLGVRPGEALVVGDRPDHDMAVARALGMPSVRVRRGRFAAVPEGDWPATRVVDELSGLPAWLNEWRYE